MAVTWADISPAPLAVVGLAASEGGSDACIALLRTIRPDSGMAFCVVQSPAQDERAFLTALQANVTQFPVLEAQDGPPIESNAVYVCPPHKTLLLKGHRMCVADLPPGPRFPIDRFFESLAETQGSRAVGVVLSGSGCDGRQGVQAIKAAGGISFAQDRSAYARAMPQSAVNTGCVDFVLPPHEIATALGKLADLAQVALSNEPTPPQQALESVLEHLRAHCYTDFSHYKQLTLHRRIRRRMTLRGLVSLAEYAEIVRNDGDEAEALCQDLMTDVTGFFREPDSFEALKRGVFPSLVVPPGSNEPVRVWVVGCASGEEAYSIAIALLEYMRETGIYRPVRVFGTDVSARAVARARRGWFSDNLVEAMPQPVRERYFVKTDDGYCVHKSLRELCTFAQHNALTEPPFHRIDLVSCRNLLVYFQTSLQRKLLPLLHFALKPGGFLSVGAAEAIDHYRELFDHHDVAHNIYSVRPGGRKSIDTITTAFAPRRAEAESQGRAVREVAVDIQPNADRAALQAYAPPGVLVDQEGHILHYRGDVSLYLSQSEDRPSHNVFKVAREGLLAPLTAAMKDAVTCGRSARREDAVVKNGDRLSTLSIHVLPVTYPAPHPPSYWIFFEPSGPIRGRRTQRQTVRVEATHDISQQLEVLTDELTAMRQHLQANIESQSSLNEDLQTANEEAQSANEELQITNEALESSKEEIQSSYEELIAVNDELRLRNQEIDLANDDLLNLFAGIETALVMVWRDLKIRRFTASATALFSLLPADIGRSLDDIRYHFDVENFSQLVSRCIDEPCEIERQVTSGDGHCYLLRIRPYRRQDGTVDGAMVMLIDIDTLAKAQRSLDQRVAELAAADRHKNEFLAILAHELRNPLAPLRNAVQVLRRAGQHDDASTIKARDMIERQVQQMSRLISDLLDAARAQHGRIRLQRAPVDLRISIEQVVDMVRPAFQSKNQRIGMRMHSQPVWVDGDAARLEQIFLNLLNNASKFTQDGGAADISLEIVESGGKGRAVVCVVDNGSGIEQASLAGLFELFTQADRSLAHSQGGLGIGLSLVRTLVGLHDGQVSARSGGLGRGTVFEVCLPLCAPPPAISHTQVGADIAQRTENLPTKRLRSRVLLVEDNADIRDSSRQLLELSGFKVMGVASGAEALEKAPGFAPDAILLDVGLPDMDGYEVACRLRALPQFAGTLLCALTGYDSPEARTRSAASGFDHHLTKPVNFDELASLLQSSA